MAAVQASLDLASEPLLRFRAQEMANRNFTILVYHYLLGQFRIQLTDLRRPDRFAPEGHGEIVQELCTYRHETLAAVLTKLRHAPEPLELARSWAGPHNCEREGGRIRLDNAATPQSPTGRAA